MLTYSKIKELITEAEQKHQSEFNLNGEGYYINYNDTEENTYILGTGSGENNFVVAKSTYATFIQAIIRKIQNNKLKSNPQLDTNKVLRTDIIGNKVVTMYQVVTFCNITNLVNTYQINVINSLADKPTITSTVRVNRVNFASQEKETLAEMLGLLYLDGK